MLGNFFADFLSILYQKVKNYFVLSIRHLLATIDVIQLDFPALKTYLWGILGQWDILLLNLTSIGFTNFFGCLIFDLSDFTNAAVITIKDETSKENL